MEQNGELRISSKIQSAIKSGVESAKPLWAGISSQFAPHFYSEARRRYRNQNLGARSNAGLAFKKEPGATTVSGLQSFFHIPEPQSDRVVPVINSIQTIPASAQGNAVHQTEVCQTVPGLERQRHPRPSGSSGQAHLPRPSWPLCCYRQSEHQSEPATQNSRSVKRYRRLGTNN
jgi:hypothetical protein